MIILMAETKLYQEEARPGRQQGRQPGKAGRKPESGSVSENQEDDPC